MDDDQIHVTPLQWGSMVDGVRQFLASIHDLVPAGQLSPQQTTKLIDDLPHLTESQLIELGEKDSSCPICINPYLTILTEEETAHAMDSPAHPVEELGVTKLDQPWQCGHIFCRRDISKWIIEGHDSCPMCRKRLVESSPPQGDPLADNERSIPSPPTQGTRAAPSSTIIVTPDPTANTTDTDPTAEPPTFAQAFHDLRRQFSERSDQPDLAAANAIFDRLLRDFGARGGPPGFGAAAHDHNREDEDEEDDRHEFSGMYS